MSVNTQLFIVFKNEFLAPLYRYSILNSDGYLKNICSLSGCMARSNSYRMFMTLLISEELLGANFTCIGKLRKFIVLNNCSLNGFSTLRVKTCIASSAGRLIPNCLPIFNNAAAFLIASSPPAAGLSAMLFNTS